MPTSKKILHYVLNDSSEKDDRHEVPTLSIERIKTKGVVLNGKVN